MQVGQLMRHPVISCGRDAKIAEVAHCMDDGDVGSVVVLDADDRVAGIVTERDIVRAMAHEMSSATTASEIMAQPAVLIHEHEDVYDAAAKMAAARCRRLPVVNVAGKLLGVVAIDDLIGEFAFRTEPR
jgi:signal-transduction protein with cAMP-binding, CBS, and nucleotidyltransferase domain